MELDTTKSEETKDGLNNTFGNTDHAGGEGTADSSTQELGIGQDTSTEDEEAKHPGETWLSNTDTLPYVSWLAKDHGHGEEDWEGVEAVHMQHLHCRPVVDLRTLLHQGQIPSLAITKQ